MHGGTEHGGAVHGGAAHGGTVHGGAVHGGAVHGEGRVQWGTRRAGRVQDMPGIPGEGGHTALEL